jgi:type IV pilus biogenesis protein CpaD/CtpE
MSGNPIRSLVLAALVAGLAACSDDPVDPVPNEFSIALQGSTVSMNRGAVTSLNVILTRSAGFTGDVIVTAVQLPPGVTVAPDTISGAETMATLVFRSTLETPASQAASRIRAQAEGTGVHSVPVTVIVREPTGR